MRPKKCAAANRRYVDSSNVEPGSNMKLSIIVMIFFLFGGSMVNCEASATLESPYPERQPDKVYKKDCWQLDVYYFHKGTPDEGMEGVLLYKNKFVKPDIKKIMQPIATPLGNMCFSMQSKVQHRPNALERWRFCDYAMIPWTNSTARERFEASIALRPNTSMGRR